MGLTIVANFYVSDSVINECIVHNILYIFSIKVVPSIYQIYRLLYQWVFCWVTSTRFSEVVMVKV